MGTFSIQLGSEVIFDSSPYKITKVIDLETVQLINLASGKTRKVQVKHLKQPDPDTNHQKITDLAAIDEKQLEIAQKRLDIINPLLTKSSTGLQKKDDVEEIAIAAGVNIATVYRWLALYKTTGSLAGLIPMARSGGRGKSRIDPAVNDVVTDCIQKYYLSKRRLSIKRVVREIQKSCRSKSLKAPHENTIRNRINRLSEELKLGKRQGREALKQYQPLVAPFPGADWPLSIVQIDHTKVDLILVDDEHRLPVGKPWITVAIDVFSRMVTGFYVSFDPPGAMSAGMCVANSILPKEAWLAGLGCKGSWPIWGLMGTLHADNAKEFRGNMLKLACQVHGINLEWRPVKKPEYGGHIERLLGTFNTEIHDLPGTTFSNPIMRGRYPSLEKSALTLSEFEQWLAVYITEVYHQKMHTSIGMSPIAKFEQGIFGNEDSPGTGIMPRVSDERRLRLDFMPYTERSIQSYGIVIDGIQYYSDVLRSWIQAKDPENAKLKRKFIIRRDPRDISCVYFYDPVLQEYFDVPYRNLSRPSMSLWELRAVRKKLREESTQLIDENSIFSGYERMLEIENQAIETTKRFRNTAKRRKKQRLKEKAPYIPLFKEEIANSLSSDLPESVEPFEEYEDLSHG